MIGIPLGVAYAHLIEALFHRYVLHGLGKKPGSFWSYHWHEHHRLVRKQGGRDDGYRTRPLFGWHAQTKEQLQIAAGFVLHLPLLPVAPLFVTTLGVCGWVFYKRHKRFHLDPEWGRREMPWHWDHHMGRDQDKNFGIAFDWYDRLAGTRVPMAPTPA